jgi:hypothetical protein
MIQCQELCVKQCEMLEGKVGNRKYEDIKLEAIQ